MPYKPKVPCRYPGCPALVEDGKLYCEKHQETHTTSVSPERSKIYTYKWRKASKAFLLEHPLCAECLKHEPPMYTPATVVDHITPHRGNTKLFWDKNNWQSLCKRCHDEKTLTEEMHPTYRYDG